MRIEAEGGARSIPPFLSPYQDLAEQLCHACKQHYGTRLVSVALFGSVARGTPQFDSDLDVLIVADDLAQGRMRRAREFERIEAALAPTLDSMRLSGIAVELSPVFKTPAEIEQGSPLLLDMTEDATILYDRAGFLAQALASLSARLGRLGARRIWLGSAWYWDLKPDFRPGEVIEL